MSTVDRNDVGALQCAQLCQLSHDELVQMMMAAVDLVGLVQAGEANPDVSSLRRHLGKKIRSGVASHSIALAALVADEAPEYAEQLREYADEVDQ